MPNDSGNPELELLARLLYGENRANMTPDEAAGIARTVYERTKLQGYPATPQEVMLQPGQYQPLAPKANARSQANAAEAAAFGPEHPRFNEFMTLAQHGWQEAQKPNPSAPTHYFAGEVPPWARGMKLTQLGAHTFGRETGRRPKAQELGSPKPKARSKKR